MRKGSRFMFMYQKADQHRMLQNLVNPYWGCIVASNGSQIASKELNELMECISAQFFLICARWKQFFVTDTIKFYC